MFVAVVREPFTRAGRVFQKGERISDAETVDALRGSAHEHHVTFTHHDDPPAPAQPEAQAEEQAE